MDILHVGLPKERCPSRERFNNKQYLMKAKVRKNSPSSKIVGSTQTKNEQNR
jgi:hypothetical protein